MKASAATIQFQWPDLDKTNPSDNFFFGAWHRSRPLHVIMSGAPSASHLERQGSNWLLVSASSPLHPTGTGLVHRTPDASSGVAFRGYVLPSLHSYSPDSEILAYWGTNLFEEHNGIFSAVVVGGDGETLTLITDVLGMGPLYYRLLHDVVLFATNPRFLAAETDPPDLLAWRCLVQTSWIVADCSLSVDIRRVPAGQALCWTRDGGPRIQHFGQLSRGTRSVDRGTVGEVEETFQQAMNRCLRLNAGSVVLPLSSGFDSRRILAAMVRRRVDFRAVTNRALQKGHRDLDARFAAEMARDFGFPHAVVDSESVDQYAADDRSRRVLVDSETRDHSWALRVMRWLPAKPCMLYDGIGGDVLGDPVGWTAHTGLAVESRSAEEELDAIAAHSITNDFDSILSSKHWPSVFDLRETLKAYLRTFLPRDNIAEVAFLLLRQRRVIASWSQQLAPPGHVPVCPYLDLDYLRLLLDLRSSDKHAAILQRACLREFWPEFYKYPGNRDIPRDLPLGSPALANEEALRCQAELLAEIRSHDGLPMLRRLLAVRGRVGLSLARRSAVVALREQWYVTSLMELVSREVRHVPCWRPDVG